MKDPQLQVQQLHQKDRRRKGKNWRKQCRLQAKRKRAQGKPRNHDSNRSAH